MICFIVEYALIHKYVEPHIVVPRPTGDWRLFVNIIFKNYY